MKHLYALIVAGGIGTRLWPVSRRHTPKQHAKILGTLTMLQQTYRRARMFLPPQRILIATHQSERAHVRETLPGVADRQLLVEPAHIGTAGAIGFGLATILSRDPDATVVTLNADAFLQHEDRFVRAIRSANEALKTYPDTLCIVGVKPNEPETGYGYIMAGQRLPSVNTFPFFAIRRFIEKPDVAQARRLLATHRAFWNTTTIVARAEHFFHLYATHLPKTFRILERVRSRLGTRGGIRAATALLRGMTPISIDYGILQKEKRLMLVVLPDAGWVDIGHWRAIRSIVAPQKSRAHALTSPHIGIDSHDNLVVSTTKRLIATIGVKNLVIIQTPDATLVCDVARAHDVKRLVATLQERGLHRYL